VVVDRATTTVIEGARLDVHAAAVRLKGERPLRRSVNDSFVNLARRSQGSLPASCA
jgi:hypothetical protein